jgi:hypothetical protein
MRTVHRDERRWRGTVEAIATWLALVLMLGLVIVLVVSETRLALTGRPAEALALLAFLVPLVALAVGGLVNLLQIAWSVRVSDDKIEAHMRGGQYLTVPWSELEHVQMW